MPKLPSLFLPLFTLSCGSDIGLTYKTDPPVIYEVEEITEVAGDIGVDGGYIYNQAVDVLFIVDESGSMSDDQESLASTMPDIYEILIGPDFIDLRWRVGITATDSSAGLYAVVEYDDPDAYLKLLTLTSFLQGHYDEAGLDAAIKSVAWDSSFHRDEADLLIVYISDEPDQSSTSLKAYENLMDRIKEHPFVVTESSIVFTGNYPYNDFCGPSYTSSPDLYLGTGYMDVSEVTVDLCDTNNWVSVLDNARDHVPTLNEKWPLSEPVAPPYDSVEVYVDGDPFQNWYFEPSENTVYLLEIPEVGSFVSIAYLVEMEEEN